MDETLAYQSCTETAWGQNTWCYPEVANEELAYWLLGFFSVLVAVSIGIILLKGNNK